MSTIQETDGRSPGGTPALRGLDIDLLTAALAVYETGSFAAAAQRLALTPSAVSHKIRRLEDLLGRSLFARTTRRLSVTADGEALAREAAGVLEAMDGLVRRFTVGPAAGRLRLGLSEEGLIARLADTVSAFARQHADVDLRLTTMPGALLKQELEAGALDLIVTLDLWPPGLPPAFPEALTWIGQRSALPGEGPLPLVVSPVPCVHRQAALRILKEAGIAHETVVDAGTLEALRIAVAAGLGIGVVPESAVDRPDLVLNRHPRLPSLPLCGYRVAAAAESAAPYLPELQSLVERALRGGARFA